MKAKSPGEKRPFIEQEAKYALHADTGVPQREGRVFDRRNDR
jgi:hypothetical protein